MEDCIFCKIVKKEIPGEVEIETETVLAFRDINPKAPVHILIIPKKHIENLANAAKEDLEILGSCQLVAKEIAEKNGTEKAFRLLTASGAGAGQTVSHLHYHLVGGWKDRIPGMEIWRED